MEGPFPGGVLNVVTSRSSGATMGPLIEDPRTRKLSFTGSTEVGRKLIAQAAEQVLNVSMELGGNAPFLVFDDADLDAAVEGALLSKMRNIGEACTSANRFHVAAGVADEFADRLAAKMGDLKVGRGTEDDVKVGDLVVTSGLGQRFPASILVGRINEVQKKEYGLYQDATVVPAVNFSRLEEVLIMTSGSRAQEAAEGEEKEE